MKHFCIFLSALFCASITQLQAQIPVLKVKNAANKAVTLEKLAVDVQIVGNIAKTVMTMTFHNNTAKILEGELTFPMPEGVTVSRYALDMNGKMREAVPVEKARATEVFESIEHRNIDPGLLEKVEGNNFRTRIYPFLANGSRTILIGYEEELKLDQKNGLKYQLPLNYNTTIAEFSLKTTVFESTTMPQLIAQPDGSFGLTNTGNTYFGEMKKTAYRLEKGLTINLPKYTNLPEVQLQKASNGYYFLVNVFPKIQRRPRQWNNYLGIIWDCSLSGLQRDHKKELALLALIIKQKQNLTVNLGLLNNTFKNAGTFVITNGNWDALKEKLTNITYDGGTDFSTINEKLIASNEYLFFSDGLSSFGKNTVALNKPVHAISSALRTDYSTLKYISLKTGGEFVNLNNVDVETAFKQLNEEQLKYLGIKNAADVRETYPSLPTNVSGHLAVAGILGQSGTNVILQFGYGKEIISEQVVRLDVNAQPLASIEVSRIWAQNKIAEMDIQYETNKAEISQLSKQFGIVTRNTSLIVLENIADYVRYEITPPAELKKEYDRIAKQRRTELLEHRTDLLEDAITMSNTLKTWWHTDFPLQKVDKKQKETNFPVPVTAQNNERYETAPQNKSENDAIAFPPSTSKLEEVVVVRGVSGYSSSLAGRVAGVAVQTNKTATVQTAAVQKNTLYGPSISIQEFKSDKKYMKLLAGKPEEAYQKYLEIRPSYLNTPQFYFDVSNWFYQQADSTSALLILSNIADLELESSDLYKVMAYKLKQTGNYKSALFLTEKILQWRPMDAQSYRDYALPLADLGQYQKALNTLYKILTQSYNSETANRDNGIEEIILTEINNLISLHGNKLNTKEIDKRLIQPLPVDIRVVLNWNKNDTDIDLWLTDPTGEKCFYSHKQTTIGGRISDDFTAGYGPEQFMLKKAIQGKYKIEVDYYGDRQLTITGPTTVTAEIYTHYASGKQQRKIIVMPLAEDKKKEGHLIGEFNF